MDTVVVLSIQEMVQYHCTVCSRRSDSLDGNLMYDFHDS